MERTLPAHEDDSFAPDGPQPGSAVNALAVGLQHEPVAAGQLVSTSQARAAQTTAARELGSVGTADVGLWEITPGVSTDVEADEVFVVIAGRASVTVHGDDDSVISTMELAPGTIGRLAAGMRTTWTVTETLRKVYILAP